MRKERDTDKLTGLLNKAAVCIREIMPEDSLCGRFGGDEFLILLPDIEKEELPGLLNALLRRGAESIMLPLSKDPFGMSIGAVFYPAGEKKFAGLLQMADAAMYEVKKAQKNSWKIA